MNRLFCIKLFTLLALALCLSVPALASLSIGGVPATMKDDTVFHAGPGTAYPEEMAPTRDARIIAIEQEDAVEGRWWLCEYQLWGSRVRAYAEYPHLSLFGDVPLVRREILIRRLVGEGTVYAAPDLNASVRATLPAGMAVAFLGFEGDYCFIEYDQDGVPCRGYVREEDFMVDLGEFAESFPENEGQTFYAIKTTIPMYADPDESGELLFNIPFDASVTVYFDAIFDRCPEGWLPVYYGGLFGYVHFRDVSDLRFNTPEEAREMLSMMGEYQD